MSANPFEYGRELGLDELVDREEEIDLIRAAIRNRSKLFLIGPRRYGKTSVLSAAEEAATREGAVVIRVDAEKYESLQLLAAALLAAATAALRGPVDRAIETVRKAAGRLRPVVSLDGEAISVRLGVDPGAEPLPVLTDTLDTIERLASEREEPVALVLDEVQAIVIEHGLPAERQMRSTVQRHRHVAYVFAGSDTRLLSAMTGDPDRPFYRMGERVFLGPVPRDDFTDFIEGSFRRTGIEPSAKATVRILDLADDVPYNVQRLAHAAWEACRAEGLERVDARTVEDALHRIVLREDPAYTQIWSQLTVNQKKALKAVVLSGGRQVLAARVSRELDIPPSSLHTALEALRTAHIVRVEAAAGETSHRLVDPFFAEWLRISQSREWSGG